MHAAAAAETEMHTAQIFDLAKWDGGAFHSTSQRLISYLPFSPLQDNCQL